MRAVACAIAVFALTARPTLAHPQTQPVDASWSGSFEPWVVACLVASAALYLVGTRRVWRRAGRGRGIGRRQAAAFWAGWIALAAALVGPIDALGTRLFSAHMIQHELLMVVAAPLLVLGRPLAAWTWALPAGWRRHAGRITRHRAFAQPWRALTDPLAAWALHALVLWLWHLPLPFQAALADQGLHALQHVAFLGSALLFWWATAGRSANRAVDGGSFVYLLTTMLHTGLLGALLTFAPYLWYPAYVETAIALGIDPLDDQRLGGLIMWVPAGLAYPIAALALAARWLARGDADAARTPTDKVRPATRKPAAGATAKPPQTRRGAA